MNDINPLLLTDYYKTEHIFQYPRGTNLVYSNLTARKSRIPGVEHMVFFGLQYFIKEYLIKRFNEDFFNRPLDEVLEEYRFAVNVDTTHIEALHKLGYLPLEIKALPEGTKVPIRVPCLTIKNTLPEFYWLPNYIETLLSAVVWQPSTSATIAHEYKKLFTKALKDTIGDASFADWMGHDFSFRGMSSPESALTSGMGHLTSFLGTDTIPAIYGLKKYYNATGLIGASVPATEHSVMCAGTGKEGEFKTFERLVTKIYPKGIVSIVSDTFDLWKVLTEFLPELKETIMLRDGKLVIRPDSGDPVDIMCGRAVGRRVVGVGDDDLLDKGEPFFFIGQRDKTLIKTERRGKHGFSEYTRTPIDKGVIELLWDVFGGTIVNGYKVLDPHVGAIYGDSITLERAKQISARLMAKGFAPIMVYGIGSFTYQYNTRDTFGLAMKATYVEVDGEGINIFKNPVTDDGTKKSAKGLLKVNKDLTLEEEVGWLDEALGELKTVFVDGDSYNETTLDEIRKRLIV